jgi:hypothetical protein
MRRAPGRVTLENEAEVSVGQKVREGERPSAWEQAELVLVGSAVFGTCLAGLLIASFPARALSLAGLPPASAFLVRQIGVLLAVLALGYLLEFRRSRGVVLLLSAEALTAVFLLASWLGDRLTIQIVAFGIQSWLAAITWAIHDLAGRQRWARVRLRLVSGSPERVRPAGGG